MQPFAIPQVKVYENQGKHCLEYSLLAILEHLGYKKTAEDMIRGMGRKKGKVLYPIEAAVYLHKLGVPAKYPCDCEEIDYCLANSVEAGIERRFGPLIGQAIMGFSDLESIAQCMRYVKDRDLGQDYKPTVEDIQKEIVAGKIPLVLINSDHWYKRKNQLRGHYIYLTGFNDISYFYHDTGPQDWGAYKAVPKKYLHSIQNMVWFDHDILFVG